MTSLFITLSKKITFAIVESCVRKKYIFFSILFESGAEPYISDAIFQEIALPNFEGQKIGVTFINGVNVTSVPFLDNKKKKVQDKAFS